MNSKRGRPSGRPLSYLRVDVEADRRERLLAALLVEGDEAGGAIRCASRPVAGRERRDRILVVTRPEPLPVVVDERGSLVAADIHEREGGLGRRDVERNLASVRR